MKRHRLFIFLPTNAPHHNLSPDGRQMKSVMLESHQTSVGF
jgi:hypothetical protein